MSENAFDSKAFLKDLTRRPGIYQMYDAEGKILYVGKAKNLRNRVSSYFRSSGLSPKTQALVARICHIEVTVTGSETEALLLEQNLIKQQRPPYNILLRDDKSYPYIFVSDRDVYPAIRFRRGAGKKQGRYFGPYPSSNAVKESLNLLQKVFRIRSCEDSFFRNRSRPCLQYQIQRCTAPCVGMISDVEYRQDVRNAMLFLEGRSPEIMQQLAVDMDDASRALDFERAAQLRDQITALRQVQEQQYVSGQAGEADVFGCVVKPGGTSVHALFVRGGRVIGSKAYHPRVSVEDAADEVLSAFVAQFYLSGPREIPSLIITTAELADRECLQQALEQHRGRKVSLQHNVRGDRAGWQRLALTNAEQQLSSYLASKQNMHNRFLALQKELGLADTPSRLECFDISHSSGEATVASCVVFDREGPRKQDYRRFNIDGITPGDDYAAMHQALEKRYAGVIRDEGVLPDLLIIDGGKGQVAQAMDVLRGLEIRHVRVVGIAKGPTRKAGFEILIDGQTGDEAILASDSPALHLLQHIRDESHRFAIVGHRAKRNKARRQSRLEDIPGVGPKRRRELLRYFGSLKEVESASIEEIAKVSSISRTLAQEIYATLHPES
ncbi:excinuclease ABC subunit UvrC [Marinobacterium weihaiense]|uniref:UvrABC system protein C n=1 Tax=Marinobacterium weihaiense TaxID=2851016 RepID=A0ABS6M6F5_9GAMM|nr:excinuclease ABC subunit UvrC [Marinobacterium weihaiense]MBV0931810.1 excinuclease ABC subunit UvrC [Marinobacterium weihaiense]